MSQLILYALNFDDMITVRLNKKISQRINNGHPWVYVNEIESVIGEVTTDIDKLQKDPSLTLAKVFSHDKKYIGTGYYNSRSQIAVRLLSRNEKETIDEHFIYRKILNAWEYRKKLGYFDHCRLVFGESDGLPQLIIDKLGDFFVIQTMALGIDVWKTAIVTALNNIFSPKGIYERNDVPVRELEGLPQQKGFLSAPFETLIEVAFDTEEGHIRYLIDIENGQKTGFFLDQQENRKSIRHIVKNAEVLGVFTYTGSFEIFAGHYGAKSVLGIDVSDNAVAMANRIAKLNGLEHIVQFQSANAFDVLKEWSKDGRQYDVVMLDPPAFTKSRDTIDKAIKGYKEVNLRGMKLVKPGGFLVTSSCTNLVSPEMFLQTIHAAAKDAKRKVRQVTFNAQAPDHPTLWNVELTHYLKFLIVQVE